MEILTQRLRNGITDLEGLEGSEEVEAFRATKATGIASVLKESREFQTRILQDTPNVKIASSSSQEVLTVELES